MKKDNSKKATKKEQVIKAASEIFKQKGYENTTMNDIAKHIHNGKSSIYYYFKSKEDIFQNVVLIEASQFRTIIINAIEKEKNPIDKIKTYITTRMKIIKVYQNFHLALKNEKYAHIHFFKRLNSIYDKEEIRLFKNILEEGVKNNYLKKNIDLYLAAVAIIMAIKGIESNFFNIDKEIVFKYSIENTIEILLYGIVNK